MNESEWRQENERLERVLREAQKQLHEHCDSDEKLEAEAIQTQKELWEEVGSISVSNGLEQLVDFLEFVDAMKRQKRSHGFLEKLKEKYAKMILSPYFGRIDFAQSGGAQTKPYYIGASSLIDDAYDILIYDWRAPVSSLFYDYEIGEAGYQSPDGTVSGAVTLKRQYKIENGKIAYMFDSNLKIDDEVLQEILSGSADSKMKAIVTSIQREQNRAIRNEQYKNMIVLGPAGSGKTSVALHRAAYLLYKYRDTITSRNILIFSPNRIFSDYISNVLPELGEDNMLQTTFQDYMRQALNIPLKKESYYEMMEYILASADRPAYPERIKNIRFKSSAAFRDILKRYAAGVEKEDRAFPDIDFDGKPVVTSAELQSLFRDGSSLPLKSRLERIRTRILFLLKAREEERMQEVMGGLRDSGDFTDSAELKKESAAVVRNESKAVRAQIDRLTAFDAVELYRRLFEHPELFASENGTETDGIRSYTLENLSAGQLYYEDQISLLYLAGALGGIPRTAEIKFVMIDEAQDYTPLQYEIFYQLFGHANITMLGDPDQSINPFMNAGGYDNLSHLFPRENTCILNLSKSYRSTVEITRFSRTLLHGRTAGESVERHGDEPAVLGFTGEEAIRLRILEDIGAYTEKGYRSIGILTRTKKEAVEAYRFLKGRVPVKAVVSGEEEYAIGAVVMPAYLSKGLEFDVVIIYNAGSGNYCREEERKLLYTACTRALHILRVYYSGRLTPLIPALP